jgi:hypothetical protein
MERSNHCGGVPSRRMWMRKSWTARTIMIMAALAPIAALAQAPADDGQSGDSSGAFVLHDPVAVGQCLCLSRSVASNHDRLIQFGNAYAAAKAHALATRAEVDRLRGQIDPNQAERLDAYRRLVAESERAQDTLYHVAQPAYAQAVSSYDEAVEAYNGSCAGQRLDIEVRNQVARTLVCRIPQAP